MKTKSRQITSTQTHKPMITNTNKTTPDWCFIGIDELEHWNLPASLAPHVTGIISIYAFNRNVATHCCELAPSYWLEFIAHQAITRLDTPETILNAINELVISTPGDGSYFHGSTIERIAMEHPERFARFTGELEEEESDNRVSPNDAVIEYWNCNPKF